MDNTNNQSPQQKDQASGAPAPEVLAPRAEDGSAPATAASTPSEATTTPLAGKRRHAYKPTHRATVLSIVVVAGILLINIGVVVFVLKSGSKNNKQDQGQVTISQGVLDKIGVNRSSIGDSGLELVVSPNARFNGEVQIGGSVSIAKGLKINSQFSAKDANLTQLEAGNTALSQLNVNGDSTLSNLNLRSNLQVTGTTKLQGAVTLSSLLTVNNSVNILGNVAVGGTLSTNGLSVRSLAIDSTLAIGGHIISGGSAPSASAGGGVGNNGTVSISGNDQAGTVAVNVGTGSVGGTLANITFRSKYSNTPHVVITPIGAGVGSFYVNRSSSGFSIGVSGGLAPGGYAFDYIVIQ
jgi:hypothetical protein